MRKSKRSQHHPDAVPFELKFTGEYDDVLKHVEAILTSPLLDPRLHPDGTLRVVFGTEMTGKKGKPPFVLDSFHLASLVEYVRSNPAVCETLEADLADDRKNWDVEGATAGKRLWACVRVLRLELPRRDVPTPEYIALLRKTFSPKEVREELAASDTPDTRTFFRLVLDCDWDEEHAVTVEYRDGKYLGLSHE